MELSDLGFDSWFLQKRKELLKPELSVARITRVDRDRYLVRNELSEVQAEAIGKLFYSVESSQDLPCVGDWALVQYYNDGTLAIIHELLPRKSFLRRKAAGKKVDYQMIASNIDTAFIMQSCDTNFNVRRLERYLVMVADGRIEPIILLSKSDLISEADLKKRFSEIEHAGISARVLALSCTTGAGLQTLRGALERGRTYCLIGSSGVGKTTLLNYLLEREEYATGPVREKDGRGRHTTAQRHLSVLDNGALMIDTPGMRELGVIDAGDAIDESFADIHELGLSCRFKDCTHTIEKGCAILQAVEHGLLDPKRHHNYLKLMKESAFHQTSYVERRKKDKRFGRMVNTVLKDIYKRKA